MNFITRTEARQNIIALGLPQIVLDAFDEVPLPDNLDIHFRYPYQILELDSEQQSIYGAGRITPIWSSGDDYTIVAYHHEPRQKGFFRFNVENPEQIELAVGLSWQQVLVKEFKDLWELELPNERLREIAGLFRFHYIEKLITELYQANLDTFGKDAAWYNSFLERLRD